MPLHSFYLNWPQIDHSSIGPAFSFFCNSLPTIRLFLVFSVSMHLCLILIWSSTCCNFDQCLLYLAKQLQSRACFGVLGFGDQLLIQFSGIAICVRRSIFIMHVQCRLSLLVSVVPRQMLLQNSQQTQIYVSFYCVTSQQYLVPSNQTMISASFRHGVYVPIEKDVCVER